jgi:hypothetical protein
MNLLYHRRSIPYIALLVGVLHGLGCSYDHEVEQVAKDWCKTIRASQVVPVYPLIEDLQPGDVFLVTLPSNEQQRLYKDRGFLPLDLQVTRLDLPTPSYDRFYKAQYFQAAYASNGNGKPKLTRLVASDGSTDSFKQSFSVPRASFPTYTVDVRRSGGFRAAIPLQSIPIGVSLLSADSATASVTIADAYTYCAQPDTVETKLRAWAAEPENRLRLLEYNTGRRQNQPLYLRVVQRVYLTGGGDRQSEQVFNVVCGCRCRCSPGDRSSGSVGR